MGQQRNVKSIRSALGEAFRTFILLPLCYEFFHDFLFIMNSNMCMIESRPLNLNTVKTLVRILLCYVRVFRMYTECLEAYLVSAHQMTVAPSDPMPLDHSCDNQKCLQTWPMSLMNNHFPLSTQVEIHWSNQGSKILKTFVCLQWVK